MLMPLMSCACRSSRAEIGLPGPPSGLVMEPHTPAAGMVWPCGQSQRLGVSHHLGASMTLAVAC